VVAKPPLRTSDADVARLGARLRQRGCTLIVMGSWPQSEARLRVETSSWSGLGQGHGYLAGREVAVASAGGRGDGRSRRARLWLPDAEQQFRVGRIGHAEPVAPMRPTIVPRWQETG
jgi:hypothetical protein